MCEPELKIVAARFKRSEIDRVRRSDGEIVHEDQEPAIGRVIDREATGKGDQRSEEDEGEEGARGRHCACSPRRIGVRSVAARA